LKRGLPFEAGRSSEGELILSFKAPLTFENVAQIWEGVTALIARSDNGSLVLDLGGVSKVDSAGVGLLRSIERLCRRRSVGLRLESVDPSIQHFLDCFKSQSHVKRSPPRPRGSVVARLGGFLQDRAAEYNEFAKFCACVFRAALGTIGHPSRFRRRECFYYLQLAGSEAMTILFLIAFLLGVVMAFQAAIQLRQFGANIFVANLVSLALCRELAPAFTAMLLAGRSGSFFAAEIGTMKVGEELDALTVMGFDLTEFITLPKVAALMIAAPLLTMWADFSGVLGAIAVSLISLDLTPYAFMHQVYTVISLGDIAGGLFKAEVFAVLIALVGCFRGFQTDMGADSVGRQTTAAVVSGLFLIIFADAVLTVLFYSFGW
jgi:phospholipid/cholesterol/gamma-HCH transport system permease protein